MILDMSIIGYNPINKGWNILNIERENAIKAFLWILKINVSLDLTKTDSGDTM